MNCQTLCLFTEDLRKKFQSLGILIEIYMVMAVSTAVCERGFSCMKRVKTDWRSSLTARQLSRLMYITLEGTALDEFDAAAAVARWWNSGVRPRRPGFTAWEGRLKEPTEEEMDAELEAMEAEMDRLRQVTGDIGMERMLDEVCSEKAADSAVDAGQGRDMLNEIMDTGCDATMDECVAEESICTKL